MYNADITLFPPNVTPTGTGGLQRTRTERQQDAVRCWATQGSVNKALTVLGELNRQLYDVRLHSALSIAPGWRADLQLDGEESSRTFRVESSNRKLGHWHLVLVRE